MSVTVITYVHCDGCGTPFDADPRPSEGAKGTLGDTASEQRQEARAEGWRVSVPGGLDYCPDCRETAR